jgi:cation diffusion facilitator family transporter
MFYGFIYGGEKMKNEKQQVALSSVAAAVFLTVIKLVVGLYTGSLGILSEAAHSALDLGAAVVTFFAVKFSDKPADPEHTYGHGKIESFSALIETALLLVTCGWIIYEAVERLFFGRPMDVIGTFWGMGIMSLSIVIDYSRSRALQKVAQKFGSQALEADALHFSSDVWSSLVVIGGLICVWIGDYFKLPVLNYGDPIAALGVSVLVIFVSINLGKRTIDVLLDTAPKGMISNVQHWVNGIKGVEEISNIRVRPSGPSYFIDLNIGINRNESHRVVHSIVREVREKLQANIPNSDIVIGTFPVDVSGTTDREVHHTVKKIVDRFPNCTNIHNIHIYEVSGEKYIAIHIEVKESMSLKETHQLSHQIGELVQSDVKDVKDVSVNFEYVKQQPIIAEDITEESKELVATINHLLGEIPDRLNCHDLKIYRQAEKISIFLHCELDPDYSIEIIEKKSKEVSTKLKDNINNIEGVHIHAEPLHEEQFC